MPDAEPLKLAMLAEVVPELWAKLIFAPHPTAIRLTFTTAADIWSALREGTAPPRSRACCPNHKRSSSGGTT